MTEGKKEIIALSTYETDYGQEKLDYQNHYGWKKQNWDNNHHCDALLLTEDHSVSN